MPVGRNDVSDAITAELMKLWPASEMSAEPAFYRTIFDSMDFGRYRAIMANMNASGRFKTFGSGSNVPLSQPFQGGLVTITPVMLGEKREFEFQTVEEVQAAINTSLIEATNNWAEAAETTRDLQCADMLRLNTATGYDGQEFFDTAHPQRSRDLGGDTFGNLLANGVAITPDTLDVVLQRFEDTNAVGENGEKLRGWNATHLVATRWTDFHKLQAIVQSELRAATGNNDKNTIQNSYQVALWRSLVQSSGTQHFYAFKAMKGLLYVNKQNVALESAYDFDSKNYMASAHLQGAAGWRNWRAGIRESLAA